MPPPALLKQNDDSATPDKAPEGELPMRWESQQPEPNVILPEPIGEADVRAAPSFSDRGS